MSPSDLKNNATFSALAEQEEKLKTVKAMEAITEQNVLKIMKIEKAAKASIKLPEKIAAAIVRFSGTMTFVALHVLWFSGWIFFNTSSLVSTHPDPFPFTFLTLVVSLEAIFLSSLILISQAQETKLTERRSHLDLQINLLTEQEITMMLKMLHRIAKQVGVDTESDLDLACLEKTTKPERVVDQIEKAFVNRRN